MKKNILAIMLCAFAVQMSVAGTISGSSAPVAIDSRVDAEPVLDSVAVAWDAAWIGGDASATVGIADNGTEVKRVTGAGEFTYTLTGDGRHDLTYTTYIGGVAQDEVYTATVFKNWKYNISDALAKQRYPWNGKVDITYTLTGDVTSGLSPDAVIVLSVTASNRVDGATYTAEASALSGETGTTEGAHHVVWDLNAQGLEIKSDEVVFTVAYVEKPSPYCVIDLSGGANAASYPVSYLADVPSGGFNTDEYKTTKLVLRLVEPGTFMMCGSYQVTLTKPFYCGVFEVTQKQYELVTGSNPSFYKGDMRPVEQVTWNTIRGDSSTYNWPSSANVDSNSFVGSLQARTGLDFDLPTEAQWEYACRAGTTSEYNNGGDTENDLRKLGRYYGNRSDGKGGYTDAHTKVGSYQPNAWGLYDMHGNVWEWCLDRYGSLSSGVTDPVGSSSGSNRVLRGGSWDRNAVICTSSYRVYYDPSYVRSYYGFRLVRTLSNTEGERSPEAVAGAERADTLCAAEAAPVAIDSRVGVKSVLESVVLPWNAEWIGGSANATVVITDNGTGVKRTTGIGEFTLNISCGNHQLEYSTFINGVKQGETYTVNVESSHIPVDTAKAATCTESGWMHEVKCRRCNTVMVEAYDFVPPLGHAGSITKPAVEPTSSEPGLTAEITCTRCGKVLQSQTMIPALGYIRKVTARQLWPHKKVEICYELAKDIGDAAVSAFQPTITARYGSTTPTATSSRVYGDTACRPGIHRIVWDLEGQSIAINQSSVTFTVSYAPVSGTSVAVAVNTSSSVRDNMSVGGTVNLGYSPFADGEVKMQIDGALAFSSTNSGVFAWQPLTLGSHVLKHISGGYEWTRVVNVTELAGEDPSAPNPPPAEDPNVSITPTMATFGIDGGNGEFTVLAGTQSVWNVRSNVDWISVTVEGTGNGEQGTAGIGEQRVLFTVAPLNEVLTRSGTITAAGKTFTVNQTGRSMKLNKNSEEYDCSDHVVHVEVSALSSTKWSVSVDAGWMSIVDAGSGKGVGSVTLAMDENLSYNARTGIIEIGTEMFTVTQLGLALDKLSFDVAPADIAAGVNGTNGTIMVTATPDLPWSAASDADWLSIHADTATGSGNGSILYGVSPNPTYMRRIGTIVVTPESASGVAARSLTVTQRPQQLITNLFAGTDGVAIAWNNPAWAVTYRVYRGATDSLSSATVLVELPNDGNCTYLDVSGNADYCYWIEAEGPLGKAISDSMYPYSPITYENLRGATNPNPAMYQKGTIVSFVSPGAVTGYTFAGWTPSQITADMSGAQTVRAEWTANRYVVAFDANGGTGEMDGQMMVYDQEARLTAGRFTKPNLLFRGWATTALGAVVYRDCACVSNLTAVADDVVTLYAVWQEKPASVLACEDAFGAAGTVTLDENDNIVVTITNDVSGTVEIPDNVGSVTIDLNGHDMIGNGRLGEAALPSGPAIRVVKGEGEGVKTQLAIGDTSDGEKGQIAGGGESAGIEIADGAAYGVRLEVDDAVSILNGDGTEQDYSLLGRGSLPWPTDGAYNPLVANVYDGYILDGDGALAGIVQIKAAKQAVKSVTDKMTKVKTATTNITVTATVTDAAGKKWSYKGNGTVEGVVTGLVCTTKGVLVPSFGVALGANGLEGEWGGFLVTGARNGIGTKGDAMMAALDANYKKSWSVALTNGLGATHLQLVVGAKGSTKISGITPDGFKISSTVQGVMGDNAFFVPYLATLKNGKLTRPANLLLTLGKDGAVDVRTSNLGALKTGGPTTDEIEVLPYAESASSKGGEAYAGAVVLNDLAYPAKFAAKGLPAGLKIDAATGAITGTPTKPGCYTATITVTSGVNGKKKVETVEVFDIGNYTDAAICVEDSYSDYCVGVMANGQIAASLGCSVSGLPAGLKFAAKETTDKTFGTIPAGTIYGVPTKAGEYTVYFKRTEKVNGKSVNHQASATFKVDALPAWAQGTFNGAVFGGVGWDGTPAGLVQNLSIGVNGKISGKLADADGLTWTLSANAYDTYDPATETYIATVVGKSGKLSVTNAMSVVAETVENPNGNDHVRGTATGDDWSAKQDCWKQEPWKTLAKAFAKAPQVTTADGVSIKFAATGTITAKGVFTTGIDAKTGKPIVYSGSCSSVLIPEGGSQYVAFVYFPPVANKFGGYAAAIRLVWNGSSFSLLP